MNVKFFVTYVIVFIIFVATEFLFAKLQTNAEKPIAKASLSGFRFFMHFSISFVAFYIVFVN